MKSISLIFWLVFLIMSASACSSDRATSKNKQGESATASKVPNALIKVSPTGEIETPQVKIDRQGNVQVPGLGMRFDLNGDIYGSDGAKAYDGATHQWLVKKTPVEAAPATPSGGQGAPAMSAADLVLKLNTLTKGFNYSGHQFGKETVMGVNYEPSLGLLGITLDDVEETAPLTGLIPLREVAVAKETSLRGGTATEGILLTCKNSDCITITYDWFAEATNKLRAGPAAKLSGAKRKSLFGFGCKPEQCQAIYQAIGDLAK